MAKIAFEASRIAAFSFDPDDLVLIDDPKHPLYDARVKLPLKPEFIANIKLLGVTVPVVVRKIDGEPVVIDGRQRVRAALEANRQRAKEGLPLLKVPAVERKGGEADAFAVTVATNEHRQSDELRAKIEKAQRLHQLGRSEDEIAVDFGVSVPTVKRWLDANPKERGAKKTRGPATRPSAKRVKMVATTEGLPIHVRRAMEWAIGELSDDGLAIAFPELAAALSPKAKKAA